MRRVQRRMNQVGADELRRVHRPAPGQRRRVRRAVQHDPDQRHRVLPRPGRVGVPAGRGDPRAAGRTQPRRADPGVERGLRVRPGGLHPRDGSSPSHRRRRVPRAGQDLRHRRRRGGARPGAARGLHAGRDRRGARGQARSEYFEQQGSRYSLPQGPAALGDLRPQRPRAGRPDLADRPAGLPQHPDVLQRRDPGARSSSGSTSRSRRAGVLFLGKAEMLLSHARDLRARSTSSGGCSARRSTRPSATTTSLAQGYPRAPARPTSRARRSCANRPSPPARSRRSW